MYAMSMCVYCTVHTVCVTLHIHTYISHTVFTAQHGTARHIHSTASYTEYDSYSSHITVLYHTMNMCVLAEFSKQKSHSMFML